MAPLFLLVFLIASASPISDAKEHHLNILDVASSLQLTRSVLSFDPSILSEQNLREAPSNSTTLSLELVPRDALRNAGHATYRSLLLSRLARDRARVLSIHLRLQLAASGLSKSDLKPQTESATLSPEELSSPVVSGSSQGSGEYFGRVGVGTPSREFFMVLDTGSDVSWLQCDPCFDCYHQSDPVFNPSSSSSYRPVPCKSSQCDALELSSCRSGQCVYQVSYGDGSFSYGDFSAETLTFNSASVTDVAMGCGHDNEGLYEASAGVLGLGGDALSLPSQLRASSFSYCLVNKDAQSSSTLDFNAVSPVDSVVAPMLRNNMNPTFFYVGIAGLSVGGRLVSIPSSLFEVDAASGGGVIVDCGTAVSRLRTAAYDALRDAFVSLTRNLRTLPGVALFDTCYDFSGLSNVQVPTVSFHFVGGQSWSLPAANYLVPVDSDGTYCFAFAPTAGPVSIIGNVQQQGTRVTFDLVNHKLGFAPAKC